MLSSRLSLEKILGLNDDEQRPRREHKGNHVSQEPSSYVAIDIETTGLDSQWNSIIELAAVKIEDGHIVDQFQSLTQPEFDNVNEFITELTGITNEMLSTASSLTDVLPKFLDFVGDNVLVAHNAHFDINFIYDNCVSLFQKPFKNDFLDTMRLSRRLFKEGEHHRLIDLVERFKIAGDIEHRALSDAIKTHQCYEYMKHYMSSNKIELASLFSNSAKHVKATTDEFDENTPVYGRVFVFTGKLEKMLRSEAMQLVANMGGSCGDSVTQETNYLVLGNNDYCSGIKDGKSNKQKKAEKLKLAGLDIEVISENTFYEMIAESCEEQAQV